MSARSLRKHWIIFIAITAAFIVLLSLLYLRLLSVRDLALEQEQELTAERPVTVIGIESSDITIYRTILGQVQGTQQVDVLADVRGKVSQIKKVMGEYAEKDEILMVLEDRRTELSMLESRNRLDAAMAEFMELERQLRQNEKLYEKGIVSRDSFEAVVNSFNAKRSMVKSQRAAYERVKWDFERLTVRSPIRGKIADIYPDTGQEVMPNERVARIVNTDSKKIVAGIETRLARTLASGTEVFVSSKQGRDQIDATGYVAGVSSDADEQSGVYTVEVNLYNDSHDFLPGEVVNLRIPLETIVDVVKIPVRSIYYENGEHYIFVERDGKAIRTAVDVRWLDDSRGLIPARMLPSGSRIITEGSAALSGGESVIIIEN